VYNLCIESLNGGASMRGMSETPFREINWTVGETLKIEDETFLRIHQLKGITVHEQVWLCARCQNAEPARVVYQMLEHEGQFYFDVF